VPTDQPPGIVAITHCAFDDCTMPLHVAGGTAAIGGQSTIRRARTAIALSRGRLRVDGLKIIENGLTAIQTLPAATSITLNDLTIQQSGGGIDCGGGKLSISQTSLTGTGQFGLKLHGRAVVDSIDSLEVNGAVHAIYVKPDDDRTIAFELTDSRLVDYEKFAIFAIGNTEVRLKRCELQSQSEEVQQWYALPPSRIIDSLTD